MMPVSTDYYEIPHTADLAIVVSGSTPLELLQHAAQGLAFLLHCQTAPHAAEAAFDLRLDAPDLETLLVDFLNEILYLVSERSINPKVFIIRELAAYSLLATVRGISPNCSCRQIKAATFHGLEVRHTNGYQATIVFDV
ncbi:MAG: archease [Anaerolineae bacterium]